MTHREFTGLRAAEDRVLKAGVPGGPASDSRRFNPVHVTLAIFILVVPLAGWVAFVETAVFFQDGVLRIIGLDLDPEARFWMGSVCFTIASIEVLWLFIWWWGRGRERDGFLTGLMCGIAVFAVLALAQITRDSDIYVPDGFDVRIVPIGVGLVCAGVAGLIMLLGSSHNMRRPPDPWGPAVSRSELDELSPHDMNALLDTRRYVLQVLSRRGLINADVDELDRKPLGSLE